MSALYRAESRTLKGIEQANIEIGNNIQEIDKLKNIIRDNETIHISELKINLPVKDIKDVLEARKDYLIQRNKDIQDTLNEIGKLLLSISHY